jgi:hypothetical protein
MEKHNQAGPQRSASQLVKGEVVAKKLTTVIELFITNTYAKTTFVVRVDNL